MNAIVTKQLDVGNFSQHQHHPKPNDKNAVEWIFLIDTLNFCFWTPGHGKIWQVCGESGYFALCAAVNRAQSNGIDITNAHYYSKISLEEYGYYCIRLVCIQIMHISLIFLNPFLDCRRFYAVTIMKLKCLYLENV